MQKTNTDDKIKILGVEKHPSKSTSKVMNSASNWCLQSQCDNPEKNPETIC